MGKPILYRKRLIPQECVLLENDEILLSTEDLIVTRWQTLRPKARLSRGLSAYFLPQGVKVSKFYDHQDNLICWYCDIITHTRDEKTNTYVMTDLLVDVLVYPDGSFKVDDLDELADAAEQRLIPQKDLILALRQLHWLLEIIRRGRFPKLQAYINERE